MLYKVIYIHKYKMIALEQLRTDHYVNTHTVSITSFYDYIIYIKWNNPWKNFTNLHYYLNYILFLLYGKFLITELIFSSTISKSL